MAKRASCGTDDGGSRCKSCKASISGASRSRRAYPRSSVYQLPLTRPARFDGDTYDPQYAVTSFSGAEPNPPGYEDGKVYHGSCHCGAVTTAVKVNGSLEDGTYKGHIIECNCSFCRQVCNPPFHPLNRSTQGTDTTRVGTSGYTPPQTSSPSRGPTTCSITLFAITSGASRFARRAACTSVPTPTRISPTRTLPPFPRRRGTSGQPRLTRGL